MNKLLIIAGIILGAVTVVLLNLHVDQVKSEQKSLSFLKLKADVSVAKGAPVGRGMLEIVSLPASFETLTRIVVPANENTLAWIDGRRVSEDLSEGSFLRFDQLADSPEKRFPAKITMGMRAVTIPVSAVSAAAFFVQPGSRVDVVGTVVEAVPVEPVAKAVAGTKAAKPVQQVLSRGETTRMVTRTLLQNIKVLAVDKATTRETYRSKSGRGYRTATVELSLLDAERLIFALSQVQGGLTLLLRNPKDQNIEKPPSVSWPEMK